MVSPVMIGSMAELKGVQMVSKSTTTEIKRMTSQTHLLSKALAMIGVAEFSSLLMTTPQLSGALAKIKNEMTQLAWSIGKHLKPSLDAVAEILRGIRTGDWSTVKKGISDLQKSIQEFTGKTIKVILEPLIGKEKAEKVKTDFENFVDDCKKAFNAGGIWSVIGVTITEPFIWLISNKDLVINALKSIGDTALTIGFGQNWKDFKNWITNFSNKDLRTNLSEGITGSFKPFKWYDDFYSSVSGAYINSYYKKSQLGEEIISSNVSNIPSNINSTSNITVDFSNANINLANGIEINEFADMISRRIAENQTSRIY